jgi:hypothetical protein
VLVKSCSTSWNAVFLLNSCTLAIWKLWLLYVQAAVAVDFHMYFVKNAAVLYSIRGRKITEMYCHCNNILSIKHFNKVYHIHLKNILVSWALVSHSCNPSYSGGRDQEDHGSKTP